MADSRDLKIIAVLVSLTIIFVLVPPLDSTVFRTILGIPMVLFFPGYSLIAALFPKKSDIDVMERLALSFGLSIAVVPLIGLGLNFTPFGIKLVPILVCLFTFTLSMCVIAHLRRLKLLEKDRFSVPFSDLIFFIKNEISDTRSKIDKMLTLILILSILASIFMLVYVIITPKQGEKFTEFYILGDKGKAEGYPARLQQGKNSSVIIGIVNHEYISLNYTIGILLEGDRLGTRHVQLNHNSTWEDRVNFIPDKTGENLRLEFLLFKEENFTAPYRDLHLWVNVSSV